jgi:uncharacterized damage-inducible protein DinB
LLFKFGNSAKLFAQLNHSSYHRGQIATLLRQLGAEPLNTDFLSYYDLQPKT